MRKPGDLMELYSISRDDAEELLRIYSFGPLRIQNAQTKEGKSMSVASYANASFARPDMRAFERLKARGLLEPRGKLGVVDVWDVTADVARQMEEANE